MAYARRRRYGRRYRRRFSRRRYRRRYTRRYRRRTRGTKSSTIKLTLDGTWQFATTGTSVPNYNAFRFNPMNITGFSQYLDTYTHFRILKCYLHIGRNILQGSTQYTSSTNNYLFVGSRPFAAIQQPKLIGSGNVNQDNLVPSQPELALRQTKWQKLKYPSSTATKVTVGFYPYTLVMTGGPAAAGAASNQFLYQRIWEAKRWMPIAWCGGAPTNPADGNDNLRQIQFFGPYMVVDTNQVPNDGEIANANTSSLVQLVMKVQFKGQR